MHEEGGHTAVVAAHHLIALAQRLLMVAGGLALLQVVGHHHAGIAEGQRQAVGLLHHAYAPVDICGIAVAGVVLQVLGNVGTGVEGLMAYEHALAKESRLGR